MADLTITAASVVPSTGATFKDGVAGANIVQGQPVYEDIADGKKWKPCDSNVSAAAAAAIGIALNAASLDQPVRIQNAGDINLGATLAIGTIYVVSNNAGGIAPSADGATGWYTTILGIAKTTAILTMSLKASGVAKP